MEKDNVQINTDLAREIHAIMEEYANQLADSSPEKALEYQMEFFISSCIGKEGYREWIKTTKYDTPLEMTYEQFINTTEGFSPEEMAMIFRGSYERTSNGAEKRQEFAGYWYQYYTGDITREELENKVQISVENDAK